MPSSISGPRLEPSTYHLRRSQNGPRESKEVIELRNPHAFMSSYEPVVTRTGDQAWKPVTDFKELAKLVRDASQPGSQVELGCWEDQKKWGLFRDGKVQDSEVELLSDRLGWEHYFYSPQIDGGSPRPGYHEPALAKVVRERGQQAHLEVPIRTR